MNITGTTPKVKKIEPIIPPIITPPIEDLATKGSNNWGRAPAIIAIEVINIARNFVEAPSQNNTDILTNKIS